jgi:hypothetical protein
MSAYQYGSPEYWAALATGQLSWEQAELDAQRAGEGNPTEKRRIGRPSIPPHDMKIRAMARLAKPISEADLAAEFGKAGRFRHMAEGLELSDSAGRLLILLINELTQCSKGKFLLLMTNRNLAERMNKAERTIKRLLSELHWAGWIYRHYKGSDEFHGLDRAAIDLGPAVYRLGELRAERNRVELERKSVRAAMGATPSLPLPQQSSDQPISQQGTSPLEDKDDTLSTTRLLEKSSTGISTEKNVARGTPKPSMTGRAERANLAKSGFGQKDRKFSGRATKIRPAAILAACPDFAAFSQGLGWPDLHRAATKLFPQMGLCPEGWREVIEPGEHGAEIANGLVASDIQDRL